MKLVRPASLLCGLLLFGFHALHYRGYLVDDAFISLRYARNLTEGLGLVYNPAERVEGYTNFLWVLLGAFGLWIDADPLAVLRAGSLVAAIVAVVVVGRMARAGDRPGARASVPAAAWLLPLPAFAYWAVGTMESMAFTALFVTAVWLRLEEGRRDRWHGSAVGFVLLTLTRPEGILCFGLSLVVMGVHDRVVAGRWPLRRSLRDIVVFGLALAPWTVWRVLYYGSLLPNTFHAKVTGDAVQVRDGLANLGEFLLTYPAFAVTVVALPPFLAWQARRGTRDRREAAVDGRGTREGRGAAAAAVWCLAAGWMAYVVAVGGDFMPFERFFLPVLPLLAVLTAWTLQAAGTAIVPSRPGWMMAGAGLLLTLHVGIGLARADDFQAFVAHRMTVVGERAGHFLADSLEPGSVVAANAVGAVGYASRLPVIDMLGLTDPVIAQAPPSGDPALRTGHRRGLAAHVLEHRPEVIFWYNTAGAEEPLYGGDVQLADDPYFRFFYRAVSVRLPDEGEEAGGGLRARFSGNPLQERRGPSGERGSPRADLDAAGALPEDGHTRAEGASRAEAAAGAESATRAGEHAQSEGPRSVAAPDLGLRFEVRDTPHPHTRAFAAPIEVRYFRLRPDLEPLWSLRSTAGDDLELFLREVASFWQRSPPPGPVDRSLEEDLENVFRAAMDQLRQEDRLSAHVLLDVMLRRGGTLESAAVQQQIAELAFALDDLPAAIEAQQRALRADPQCEPCSRRLGYLLEIRWPGNRSR